VSGDGLLPGALVEATIEKGVFRGRGLARLEGRVVFVPRAHPGDHVRARVTEVHAGWAEAALVEVLSPSPDRRVSPCPYVPRCGGCAYQDYGPEAELRLKQAVMLESLARAGASWDGPVGVHPSPETGWRMRASLHFESGDGLQLTAEEGSRRVVDLEMPATFGQPTAPRDSRRLTARPGLAARPRSRLSMPDAGPWSRRSRRRSADTRRPRSRRQRGVPGSPASASGRARSLGSGRRS
jgi:23S rRNA (uracil1939-C5)-methyltransferase